MTAALPIVAAPEPVDFRTRATSRELMDADDLDPATYAALITDLARVNTITLARRPTLAWLRKATKNLPSYTLVDVGFGHGDMLRAIAAQARDQSPRLTGVDLNPRSAPVATAATPPNLPITYVTGRAEDLSFTPDFIISSITTHHMTDPEIVDFLKWMEATASRGWLINDLHRHPIAWAGFRFIATLFNWHPIVRHDGALSVRRSFTRADWHRLLAAANLTQPPVKIRWHIPFRWTVGRVK